MQPSEAITKGPNERFVHVSGVSDDFGRDAADKTLSSERRARTKGKQLCFTVALLHLFSSSLSHSVLLSLSSSSPAPPFFSLSIHQHYFTHFLFISLDDSGRLSLSCIIFSVRAFISFLLCSFLSCIFISFHPFLSFLFLLSFFKQCTQCCLVVCGLVFERRVKVHFFLSCSLFLLSPCCLMGGTPWSTQTHTQHHQILWLGLIETMQLSVCDCIWNILCCSCSKFQAQWRNSRWVLKAGVVATWPSVWSLFSSWVKKAEELQPFWNPNSLYNNPLNPRVTSEIQMSFHNSEVREY